MDKIVGILKKILFVIILLLILIIILLIKWYIDSALGVILLICYAIFIVRLIQTIELLYY